MPVPTSHTSWHFMSSSVYQALCEPWTDSLAGPLQQPYQVALNSSPQVAAQGPEAQSVVACATLPTRQHNHVLPPSKFGHFPTTCANLGQQPSFLFVPALPGLGGGALLLQEWADRTHTGGSRRHLFPAWPPPESAHHTGLLPRRGGRTGTGRQGTWGRYSKHCQLCVS